LAVYRTTDEILQSVWENLEDFPNTDLYPAREYCNTWQELTYKDIQLWEMICHIPGGISVYAAWNPYTEFYILVHDLFKKLPCGVEEFYGINAERKIIEKLKTLSIDLSKNTVWINPAFSWMYEQLTPLN